MTTPSLLYGPRPRQMSRPLDTSWVTPLRAGILVTDEWLLSVLWRLPPNQGEAGQFAEELGQVIHPEGADVRLIALSDCIRPSDGRVMGHVGVALLRSRIDGETGSPTFVAFEADHLNLGWTRPAVIQISTELMDEDDRGALDGYNRASKRWREQDTGLPGRTLYLDRSRFQECAAQLACPDLDPDELRRIYRPGVTSVPKTP